MTFYSLLVCLFYRRVCDLFHMKYHKKCFLCRSFFLFINKEILITNEIIIKNWSRSFCWAFFLIEAGRRAGKIDCCCLLIMHIELKSIIIVGGYMDNRARFLISRKKNIVTVFCVYSQLIFFLKNNYNNNRSCFYG